MDVDKKLQEFADLLKARTGLNINSSDDSKNKPRNEDAPSEDEFEFYNKIISAILLIIIVAGLIGNVLNLIVFCKKSMRKSSTFRFLCYLSAADLLVLLVCSSELFIQFAFAVEIRIYSVIVCRLHTFLTYFLTHISSVILMIISVDRALVMSNRSLTLKGCFKRNSKSRQLSEPISRSPSQQVQTLLIANNGNGNASVKPNSIMPNVNIQKPTETRMNSTNSSRSRFRSSKLSFLCDPRIHRVDIVMIIIAVVIALLNLHYILLLNVNLSTEGKQSDLSSPYSKKFNFSNFQYDFARTMNISYSGRSRHAKRTPVTTRSTTKSTTEYSDLDNQVAEDGVLFNTVDSYYTEGSTTADTKAKKDQLLKELQKSMSGSDDAVMVCFPDRGTVYYQFLDEIWLWIDICVYSFIPFIVMSFCSAVILIRIRKNSQTYMKHLSSNSNQSNFLRRLKRNRQLLYMLLITNLYFFISLLPYCVFFVMKRGKKSANLIQLSVHILCYTNNAINFIFYGFSSQKYREELKSLFCPAGKQRAKPVMNRANPAKPIQNANFKAVNNASNGNHECKPAPKKFSVIKKNSSKRVKSASNSFVNNIDANEIVNNELPDNKCHEQVDAENSGGNISNDNPTNINSILEMNESKEDLSKNSLPSSPNNELE